MKIKLAICLGALALALVPTAALAVGGPQYEVEKPTKFPTAGATTSEKTKAYGVYCRGFSKKHVAGTKRTPFSTCVTTMARAATTTKSPRAVCAAFSKVRAPNTTQAPFSKCVVGATQVKKKVASS